MIRRECYTREWIQKVSSDLQYPDTNLIEKVIRAFSLIELLSSLRLPPSVPKRLGKLRLPSPEAYFYWVKAGELLTEERLNYPIGASID